MSMEAMAAIMIIAMCALFGVVAYQEAEVDKACYAAAATNPAIKCKQ